MLSTCCGNCSISDQYLLLSDCGFFSFLSYDLSGSSAPNSLFHVIKNQSMLIYKLSVVAIDHQKLIT